MSNSFTMTMEMNNFSPEESHPTAARFPPANESFRASTVKSSGCRIHHQYHPSRPSQPQTSKPTMAPPSRWLPFKHNSEHLNISILLVTVLSIVVVSLLLFLFTRFVVPSQAFGSSSQTVAIINPVLVSVAVPPPALSNMSMEIEPLALPENIATMASSNFSATPETTTTTTPSPTTTTTTTSSSQNLTEVRDSRSEEIGELCANLKEQRQQIFLPWYGNVSLEAAGQICPPN